MEKEVENNSNTNDKITTDTHEQKERVTKSEFFTLKINKENEEKLYKFIEKLNKDLYNELFKTGYK